MSVAEARQVEPNAEKYLLRLAKRGEIEKVSRGWYWVPAESEDVFAFLTRERHFKVLQKQTAASWWNGDFIHCDYFSVAVKDKSYGRALEDFAASQGWNVSVEARDLKEIKYRRIRGNLYVEALEETIVDCVKEWAFVDAFASLHENRDSVDWARVTRHYWERIPRTDTRVGQVLQYGTTVLGREGQVGYPATRARLSDSFVRRQVEEAAEKVIELG